MKIRLPRVQYRDFEVDVPESPVETRAAGETEARRYAVSFSSEAPVRRFGWDIGEYFEVLSHKKKDVDLSRAKRGLPMLKSHQILLHCGSVTDIENDEGNGRLKGFAEFSSIPLGQEQETLLREGHLKTVSVGYEVLGLELISKDGKGIPTYSAKWRPLEVSPTPVPADHTVGFGRKQPGMPGSEDERQLEGSGDWTELEIEDRTGGGSAQGERTMAQGNETGVETLVAPVISGDGAAGGGSGSQERNRGAEIDEILGLAAAHGMDRRAREWVARQMTPDQVRQVILSEISTRATQPQPAAEALDDMPERDRGRYSVQSAIRQQVERMEGKRDKYEGIEAEVHAELTKVRTGADHGGIRIPWRLRSDGERTLGTNQPSGGATLVGQQVMPDMIDLLRNRALVLAAGARLYSGLQGVVLFNKKTAAPTVEWMQENPAADATASEGTYGYVALSPKTLIGTVQVPRQLLVMSSIDVEADIRSDLASGTSLAIDLGAIHGTGADKQPVGIYSAAGVQSHAAGGVPDLTDITTMIGMLADKNADEGALAFMTTPLMAAVMMRTPVVSGQSPMIWTGTFRDGQMSGYPAYATNQVSKTLEASTKHGLIFANWNDLAVGMWGNDLEIVVDVVTKAARGQIVITSYAMADTAVLRGDSFVKATGATIS